MSPSSDPADGSRAALHYKQGCKDENLVAFCDVDRSHSAENMKNWRTTQPFFDDFRVMLDKMHKDIDAIVVSTPDHTHFPATLAAMERGIHVYTQKPLTHNIWQARTLVKARDRYKVVTQMGNQGHAGDGIRKSVEAVRTGVIGEVGEVFARNSGPEMGGRHFANPSVMPPPPSPVPDRLAWDLWPGPAAKREFSRDYLPYKWRAFYDFGSGMLGDWGCHTFDTPVWALDLDPPQAMAFVTDRAISKPTVTGHPRHCDFHPTRSTHPRNPCRPERANDCEHPNTGEPCAVHAHWFARLLEITGSRSARNAGKRQEGPVGSAGASQQPEGAPCREKMVPRTRL